MWEISSTNNFCQHYLKTNRPKMLWHWEYFRNLEGGALRETLIVSNKIFSKFQQPNAPAACLVASIFAEISTCPDFLPGLQMPSPKQSSTSVWFAIFLNFQAFGVRFILFSPTLKDAGFRNVQMSLSILGYIDLGGQYLMI